MMMIWVIPFAKERSWAGYSGVRFAPVPSISLRRLLPIGRTLTIPITKKGTLLAEWIP